MKNKFLLLFIIPFLFGACKNGEKKQVKEAAENYLIHFKNFEFDKAKEYSTMNAALFLDRMKNYFNTMTKEEAAAAKDNVKDAVVEIEKIKLLKDNQAVVHYKFVQKNKEHSVQSLHMRKNSNGKWLADEYAE